MDSHFSLLSGFAVALCGSILIGIDRERHKGSAPRGSPAGIRTFALTGLCGALPLAIDNPILTAGGAALIAVLATIKHMRDGMNAHGAATEWTLLLTYV